jgi:predicted regulator of Ras-like GTPase activity (Roadblock/LC7/MglB family)
MASDVPAGLGSDPGWLLGDLTGRVPGVRSAVLLSADGLVIAGHGLGADAADELAAIASGLFSVARAAARFGGTDGVRQVVIEMDGLMLFTSAAGAAAVLAVLAGQETDAGVLGYEMGQLVKSVAPFLAAQPRQRGTVTRVTE